MAFTESEGDEDEGSPPRGGVYYLKRAANPDGWENRKISGSPPEPTVLSLSLIEKF
jgi:hypothetical protein